nr:hypothetical protein [Sorangium cellulosum]
MSEPSGTSRRPNTSVSVAISVASPSGVPVAWHSSSETSPGSTPAIAYAARIARSWPSTAGASRPRPRPSFDSPTPRITPRMRLPAASASDSRSSTTNAAPSAGTRPSAAAENGRLCPVRLRADSAQNPMWMKRSSDRHTAPASIRSTSRSCSRSQASAIA